MFAVVACGSNGDVDDGPSGDVNAAGSSVPFDRAFIDGMVPHHEGAIEMAKEAKAAGLSEPALVATRTQSSRRSSRRSIR